jgi:hypothetical protein
MQNYAMVVRSSAVSLLVVALVACETAKSSSPLSPNVAGPMEGISVTVPLPVEPGLGQKIKDADQPVSIVIEEARTNGPRPITMAFDIAADVGFTNLVFSRTGIAPTGEGLTRLRLPDRLQPGRTYYWRLKADDGANSSGWSNAAHFEIQQPIVIGVPVPLDPVGNDRVSTNTPEFRVRNGNSSGPHGELVYNFQVSENQSFSPVFTNAWVVENGGETRYTMPPLPAPDRTFFWRVRISDGPNVGAWSNVEAFRSPLPVVVPPPSPGPGPNPGGDCVSSSPLAIVACERSKFGFMSSGEIVQFLSNVASSLNKNGISNGPFGILRKTGGHQCNGWSCDIVCSGQGNGQKQWDVLSDAEGAQAPVWSGPFTVPNIRIDLCEIK